jgi:hypothetical protein
LALEIVYAVGGSKHMQPSVKDLNQIRQDGMEKAASIWESLELLSNLFHPVNIYKAACSIKCAEFMMRLRDNPASTMTLKFLMAFLDRTLEIAEPLNDYTNRDEGMDIVKILEQAMPFTAEVFQDPTAYATRQHVYDGIIMLAAAKMGKEIETREVISRFQEDVVKAVMFAQFASDLVAAFPEMPDND